jgi:osmotically-inducible protein OsmY
MRKSQSILALAWAASIMACTGMDTDRPATQESAANNTAQNERDREGNTLTPMDQGESEADRAITQAIRQAIVANDSLSLDAKNVKVITVNGMVTLRGPVRSVAEKQAIEAAARALAGSDKVDDQLEVVESSGG